MYPGEEFLVGKNPIREKFMISWKYIYPWQYQSHEIPEFIKFIYTVKHYEIHEFVNSMKVINSMNFHIHL